LLIIEILKIIKKEVSNLFIYLFIYLFMYLFIYYLLIIEIELDLLGVFNLNNNNRISNSNITFKEEEALNKILLFIIENNLSFRLLDSISFKDLLSYFNK
jgi:hypothetical protein